MPAAADAGASTGDAQTLHLSVPPFSAFESAAWFPRERRRVLGVLALGVFVLGTLLGAVSASSAVTWSHATMLRCARAERVWLSAEQACVPPNAVIPAVEHAVR